MFWACRYATTNSQTKGYAYKHGLQHGSIWQVCLQKRPNWAVGPRFKAVQACWPLAKLKRSFCSCMKKSTVSPHLNSQFFIRAAITLVGGIWWTGAQISAKLRVCWSAGDWNGHFWTARIRQSKPCRTKNNSPRSWTIRPRPERASQVRFGAGCFKICSRVWEDLA